MSSLISSSKLALASGSVERVRQIEQEVPGKLRRNKASINEYLAG